MRFDLQRLDTDKTGGLLVAKYAQLSAPTRSEACAKSRARKATLALETEKGALRLKQSWARWQWESPTQPRLPPLRLPGSLEGANTGTHRRRPNEDKAVPYAMPYISSRQ